MSNFRRRPLVLFVFSLTLATIVPHVILACDTYKYSPDGKFCFCYTLAPTQSGYQGCSVVVYDPLNGNTSCSVGPICTPSDPYDPFAPYADGGGCWWTDLSGGCILAF